LSRAHSILFVWIALVAGVARGSISIDARADSQAPAAVPSAPAQATPPAAGQASAAPQNPPVTAPPSIPPEKPKRPQRGGDDEDGGFGLGRLPPGVPPEFEGLGVMVVNRLTGKTAANVRVRWATQPVLDGWVAQGASLEHDDPEDLLAKSKDPLMTEAAGVAITPSAPGRMLVDARIGTLYGYAWVDRNRTSQARIELSEDRDIVVQTTDANGAPLPGVTVLLRDSSCSDLWRAETSGEDAKAKFRHAWFRIERDASPGDCWLFAEGVMPGSTAVRISRSKLPVSDVHLDVAPSARVVCHITDLEGASITKDVRVALSGAGVNELCGRRTERIAKNGEAIFERVELGRDLVIDVDGFGVFEDLHASAHGPTEAGHDTTVNLRFARRWPVAKLTFADAQDKPLAGAKVAGWFVHRDAAGPRYEAFSAPIETDDAGHARLAVRTPSAGAGPSSVCFALRNAGGDWISSASAPIPSDWTSGERDLGAVRLAELPVLAAGYVIDDRGASVVDATVEISSAADSATPLERFTTDPRWSARSDARGYFKLRGIVDGPALAITAFGVGYVQPARVAQKPGDVKTKLTLSRCSSLTGHILLPGRLPIEWVRLTIDTDEERLPLRVDFGGWFRCQNLKSGGFALSVYVEGIDDPVHFVERVDVRPGVEVNDGRVALIDLRNRLTFVTLNVLAADGGTVENGVLRVVEHVGEDENARSIPIQAGSVSFATLDAAAKVEVRVPGFLPKMLSDLTGDVEVRLDRAPH
jgi:hypothetical protein